MLVTSLEKPRLSRGPRWSRYVLGLKREASKLSVDGAIRIVTEETRSLDMGHECAKHVWKDSG